MEAAMRVLLAVVMCGVAPVWAGAQTARATLPRNDTTISLGWSGAEHAVKDEHDWHGSVLVGLAGGHYWTDHLKTEVDASWTRPRGREIYETIQQQGGFTYALSNYRADDIRFGVVQLYQFGRNAWVHPYVGIGADVVRRQGTLERDQQSRSVFVQNRSVPVSIPAAREQLTTVFAEAVVKTGLKMYVTEKAFFNTELKFGVRSDIDHVVWKFGVGVDF
jgi:outer membrane protein with beta-barrel domain